ncbi:DUF6153 family protein [Catellatospora bangladeshensis]|uniref:Uncharacterized protein n=1 Tax=Catellatospora bangladeshensis TaxID=310355 RepID=A0A8J3JNH7_9ACTN|nr:DUF6153 family protein [Catellatospora bangladeshensis]GIF82125.1 hypothetical protein Cba03nite_34740 [Catellatospora bangladeshensis]
MTGVRRAVPRALLLAVLFGLAIMHTFGHGAHSRHATGPHHAQPVPAIHAPAGQGLIAVTPIADDGDCHGCRHTGWHVFSVCLAVLSVLVLVAFVALRIRLRLAGLLALAGLRVARAVSRGPPDPPPLRLRLARLSVSRT